VFGIRIRIETISFSQVVVRKISERIGRIK
jgi:hypothetical protein